MEWDNKKPKSPFDRHPVIGYRLEQGDRREEWFYIVEMDLPNDDLGPMTPPAARTEADARTRLTDLGLAEADVEARIAWAKEWMATRILPAGGDSVMWMPPL
jgi:hypothetical protein